MRVCVRAQEPEPFGFAKPMKDNVYVRRVRTKSIYNLFSFPITALNCVAENSFLRLQPLRPRVTLLSMAVCVSANLLLLADA